MIIKRMDSKQKEMGELGIFLRGKLAPYQRFSIERTGDTLYRDNSYSKDEVEFNVPDGYKIYHLPEPMEIINQYFEWGTSK